MTVWGLHVQRLALVERFHHRECEIFPFVEQHRAAAGSELIYSQLFYEGSPVNAPNTRPPSDTESGQILKKDFNKYDGIPHLFLNAPNGVSYIKEDFISKVSPPTPWSSSFSHTITADKLWQSSNIIFITTYRTQALMILAIQLTMERYFDDDDDDDGDNFKILMTIIPVSSLGFTCFLLCS